MTRSSACRVRISATAPAAVPGGVVSTPWEPDKTNSIVLVLSGTDPGELDIGRSEDLAGSFRVFPISCHEPAGGPVEQYEL
jgi:hypothetical protein